MYFDCLISLLKSNLSQNNDESEEEESRSDIKGVCLDVCELTCPIWDPREILSWSSNGIWLFLQNIKDPMNFGAILRTSFYLGVNRIIVPNKKSCKLSPVVSKASSGALEVIDIQKLGKSTEFVHLSQWWIDNGGEIIGADSCEGNAGKHNFLPWTSCTSSKPVLLVVGNEGEGLDEDISSLCQKKIHIQSLQSSFSSEIDSLNVSVATGILLHWLQMSKAS